MNDNYIRTVFSAMKKDKETYASCLYSIEQKEVLCIIPHGKTKDILFSDKISFKEKDCSSEFVMNKLSGIKKVSWKDITLSCGMGRFTISDLYSYALAYHFLSPNCKIDVCFSGDTGCTLVRCSEMIIKADTLFFLEAELFGSHKTRFYESFVTNQHNGDTFVGIPNIEACEPSEFIREIKEIHISDDFIPFSLGELRRMDCPCPDYITKMRSKPSENVIKMSIRLFLHFNDKMDYTQLSVRRFCNSLHIRESYQRSSYNDKYDMVTTYNTNSTVSRAFQDQTDFHLFLANIVQNLSGTITKKKSLFGESVEVPQLLLSDDYYIAEGEYIIEFDLPLQDGYSTMKDNSQIALAKALGCTNNIETSEGRSHLEFESGDF